MEKRNKTVAVLLLLAALLGLSACGGQKAEAKPLDMQAIYDSIAAQVELPDMMQLSEKRMQKYYGIDASACPQAVVMVNEAGLSVDEIWLIEAADEKEAEHIQSVAESRIEQLCAETEKYSPELYAVSKAGQVIRQGVNVALFISPDAAAMAEIFRNAGK